MTIEYSVVRIMIDTNSSINCLIISIKKVLEVSYVKSYYSKLHVLQAHIQNLDNIIFRQRNIGVLKSAYATCLFSHHRKMNIVNAEG